MKNLLKQRKFQATLLISFTLLLELVASVGYRRLNTIMPFPEILYYVSQITSSIFVTSGVVIAVWQYYLSCKSAKTSIELQQVQRAIDLSAYYKDNILQYSAAIEYIYNRSGILNILSTLKLEELNDFDSCELNKLFTQEQIQELKTIQSSDCFIYSVMEANIIYNLNLNIRIEKVLFDKNNAMDRIAASKNEDILAFLSHLVCNILNNMEFFALHFSHKTADESVVYQSLHQSYFKLIQYLYYYIAKGNDDPSDKYYTNTINLFLAWQNENNCQKEHQAAKNRDIPRGGTVIEKIN